MSDIQVAMVTLRMTAAQKREVEERAKRAGVSMNNFILWKLGLEGRREGGIRGRRIGWMKKGVSDGSEGSLEAGDGRPGS